MRVRHIGSLICSLGPSNVYDDLDNLCDFLGPVKQTKWWIYNTIRWCDRYLLMYIYLFVKQKTTLFFVVIYYDKYKINIFNWKYIAVCHWVSIYTIHCTRTNGVLFLSILIHIILKYLLFQLKLTIGNLKSWQLFAITPTSWDTTKELIVAVPNRSQKLCLGD